MKFNAAGSSPCIFEDNVVSAGRQPGASIMVQYRPALTYAEKNEFSRQLGPFQKHHLHRDGWAFPRLG